MSYIWDQGGSSDQSIKMAHDLFKFIADLAKSENSSPLLNSLLDVFRDTVEVAFFWRHLLKVAAQFPEVFAPHLFELCVAKPIQMGNETFHELSLFLQAAVLEFTPEQLLQIEEAILALSREATDKDDPKLLERRRNLFLAQIPLNLLKTDEAREILEKMERENDIPENRPLVRFSTHSESYSQEEWLQDQGVDTTTPENEELQRFFKTLDKFTSDWLNDEPTEEAAESIISSLQKVYDALNSDTKADKEIIELLWNKLISCVAILSRVADNPERDFCRQVLLHGAIHELPKLDPQRDTELDTLVYSPYPRDEAARGLLRLVAHQSDAEILDKIEDLARDHVPSVRMADGDGTVPRSLQSTRKVLAHRRGHIAILNHLRDIAYCFNLGKWKYLFCRIPLTNRSLICSKQVVHNAWVRTKVLPFNQMSSTGFSCGAYGANRVQSIFHSLGARSAWSACRKSRMARW